MTTHSSIFALENPWTEEPGKLQCIESQKVRYGLAELHIDMLIILVTE